MQVAGAAQRLGWLVSRSALSPQRMVVQCFGVLAWLGDAGRFGVGGRLTVTEVVKPGGGAINQDQRDAMRWAVAAARAADSRTGVDTTVMAVGDILAVTEFFVVTHGHNPRQVRAITEGVEEDLRAAGGPAPVRIEGAEARQWVLIDYGNFVVHVFDGEQREFYRLEQLWGDCPVLDWRAADERSVHEHSVANTQ